MTTTLNANIALAIAAAITLCAMLRLDVSALQRNGFSNSRFYSHLLESGSLSSIPRLVAAAVLMGSITTMARDSWMVVALLAAVLLITGIYLLAKKHPDAQPLKGRSIAILAASVIVALAATAATGLLTGQQDNAATDVSLTLQLAAILSPVLIMAINWPISLFNKDKGNAQ